MPRALVEAIEVGIRRALLDDKDTLTEPQHLVEIGRGQLIEALPFHRNLWHAGHPQSLIREWRQCHGTARLRPVSLCSDQGSAKARMARRRPGRTLGYPQYRILPTQPRHRP